MRHRCMQRCGDCGRAELPSLSPCPPPCCLAAVQEEYAPLYSKHGLGLTTWSPLASGILTGGLAPCCDRAGQNQ